MFPFSDDSYWVAAPASRDSPTVGKGDVITLANGKTVVVVGTSTLMLKVRPLHWWERLWFWMLKKIRRS